jgi:signal transduction histidine kinase/CheY-like chemotaxis protein
MKLRILHLEDNENDAELIRLTLARSGLSCDIRNVNSGDDYLAALQWSDFDIILSDSGIPGYNGLEAMSAARDRCPTVPFIFVSGQLQPSAATGGARHPANRVSKSELSKLAPAIESALERSSSLLARPPVPTPAPSATAVRAMQKLVSVVQQLSLARNLQAVMDIVRRAARDLASADGACFVLRDGDLCFYAEEDAIGPLWKGQRFPMSACVSGWAMLNKQSAVIEDIYEDPRVPHDAYRPTFVKSMVVTPIRTTAPIGAIGVYWAKLHAPTTEETELLKALADSTSVAIESLDILANLEKRVAERTQELHRRSVELEVLNRELEAFSYSVAHDLRAPLLTIDGFSQVLLESFSAQLDETGRGHLDRISTAVRRMHLLINDLIGLSKVVCAPMHRSQVNLSHTANEVLTALRENPQERSPQTTEVFVAPDLIVEGDQGLLRIALANLLANAWKFTSKTAAPRIDVGMKKDDQGRNVYFVRDNGAGFDLRFAHTLFGPFQRFHTQSQFPGTGIGLATVQRIIHRHGGQVWAESAVDQGACFYFTLL